MPQQTNAEGLGHGREDLFRRRKHNSGDCMFLRQAAHGWILRAMCLMTDSLEGAEETVYFSVERGPVAVAREPDAYLAKILRRGSSGSHPGTSPWITATGSRWSPSRTAQPWFNTAPPDSPPGTRKSGSLKESRASSSQFSFGRTASVCSTARSCRSVGHMRQALAAIQNQTHDLLVSADAQGRGMSSSVPRISPVCLSTVSMA